MHIHILGICGTFMGGIAMIAKQAGFKVTGSDKNVSTEHACIHLTITDNTSCESDASTLTISFNAHLTRKQCCLLAKDMVGRGQNA